MLGIKGGGFLSFFVYCLGIETKGHSRYVRWTVFFQPEHC